MPRRAPKPPPAPGSRNGNRLLRLFRSEDLAALEPHLEPFPLKAGVTLIKPGISLSHVYFVQEGMVSLVQLMENGKFTETGIVGREGLVGGVAMLGASAFSHEAVVQISGSCLRMKAGTLRIEGALRPAMRDLLLRYISALFSQISQSVVCNNQHSVQSRLARWLAMGADCIESDELPLTHELLSVMLGVRRSSVSEALMLLKSEGVITTHQGGMTIIDRPALIAATCECYGVVRNEFRRLLGPSIFQDAGGGTRK